MKPFQALRTFFRRHKPRDTASALVEPTATLATPEAEAEPQWKQKIRRVNELCEQRKRDMHMRQGGRVVDVDVNTDPVMVQQKEPF